MNFVDDLLPPQLATLEKRDDYPYDFLFAQITHPARVDNGPPLPHMADFVRNWNASGRQPLLIFTTIDGFSDMLHRDYGDQLFTWSGDWADWWADGVGSSIYETSLNRSTEELLPVLDFLAAHVDGIDPALVEEAYHLVSLYDEHTWGAFSSIRRPHSHFARAQYNRKASQGEDTLLRYRLTSSADYDPAASSRFAINTTVPPLIVRVPGADLGRSGNFLHCDPQGQCEIQIKRAADGRGLILHAYNLDADEVMQRVAFPVGVLAAAWRCTPAEVNQEPLDVRDNAISLPVPSRSVACARVAFQ